MIRIELLQVSSWNWNAEAVKYTYLYVQAPPATVFLQDPQCQIPTALLFILVCKMTKVPHVNMNTVMILNVSKNRTYLALQRGSSPCHRMSRCTWNAGRFQFSSPSSSATRHNAFHIYQRSPPSWCAWPVNINTHKNNEYSFIKIYLLHAPETDDAILTAL